MRLESAWVRSDGLVEASAKGGFGRRTRFLNPRADRVETSDTGDYDGYCRIARKGSLSPFRATHSEGQEGRRYGPAQLPTWGAASRRGAPKDRP
jgi:hypothetical protein